MRLAGGLPAGLLVFGFACFCGEPQVDRAIAIQTALDQARAQASLARGIHPIPDPEIISRRMRASFSLLTGCSRSAIPGGGGRPARLVRPAGRGRIRVGGAGAGVGIPDQSALDRAPVTIGSRTLLFAVMLGVSVALMAGAAANRRHLVGHHGQWSSCLHTAAFFVAGVAVRALPLPAVYEVPAAFPATLPWRFRLDSLAMQLFLCVSLSVGFGWLNQRLEQNRADRSIPRPVSFS